MNIRQRIVETYVPSYYYTYKAWENKNAGKRTGGFFRRDLDPEYDYVDRKMYIESKTHKETILEYLNPETKNWEPLPTVKEDICVPKKVLECTKG